MGITYIKAFYYSTTILLFSIAYKLCTYCLSFHAATVDYTAVRERIMNMKIVEFIKDMNAACFPIDDVLDGMAEVRTAIYNVVSIGRSMSVHNMSL